MNTKEINNLIDALETLIHQEVQELDSCSRYLVVSPARDFTDVIVYQLALEHTLEEALEEWLTNHYEGQEDYFQYSAFNAVYDEVKTLIEGGVS